LLVSFAFPTDFKEQVRERTNLVELVRQTVALNSTRGGSDYVGLCPFHDDHSPSFHVYPDRQSYRCWSCNEGGDCFSFLQKIEGLTFPETVERLATLAGLEIPRTLSRSNENLSNREQLYQALAWAEEQYHWYLMNSRDAVEAREYFAGRDYDDDALRHFRLGYHPNDWGWLIERARDQHSMANLLAARLIGERKSGNGYYDNFVDRVTFPIRNDRGQTVGFGGRILPGREDKAKYWNSPDSELFSKNRLLYAFDVAKEPVRKSRTALVTEGYTDCISCHIHGVTNVVATLGTALTENHVTLLKRFAEKVVLVYDGDKAGQEAAERSLSKFVSQDIDLRILTLPEGQDPADYLAEHGSDNFNALIESAVEVWEHKFRILLNRYDINTVSGGQRIMDDMLELLAAAPGLSGTIREDIVLGKLSTQLGIDERNVRLRYVDVRTQFARRQSNRYNNQDVRYDDEPEPDHYQEPSPLISNRIRREEQEVLEIILSVPDKVDVIRQHIGRDDFIDLQLGRLLEVCFDQAEQGESPSIDRVTAVVEDPELKNVALRIDASRIEKEIEKKITESDLGADPHSLPEFITKALENLKRRRAKQSVELSQQKIARMPVPSGALDSDTIESLLKHSEFHQKRAT
jgi:DNA primase